MGDNTTQQKLWKNMYRLETKIETEVEIMQQS
jgi:hypothetical protein